MPPSMDYHKMNSDRKLKTVTQGIQKPKLIFIDWSLAIRLVRISTSWSSLTCLFTDWEWILIKSQWIKCHDRENSFWIQPNSPWSVGLTSFLVQSKPLIGFLANIFEGLSTGSQILIHWLTFSTSPKGTWKYNSTACKSMSLGEVRSSIFLVSHLSPTISRLDGDSPCGVFSLTTPINVLQRENLFDFRTLINTCICK